MLNQARPHHAYARLQASMTHIEICAELDNPECFMYVVCHLQRV